MVTKGAQKECGKRVSSRAQKKRDNSGLQRALEYCKDRALGRAQKKRGVYVLGRVQKEHGAWLKDSAKRGNVSRSVQF